MTTNHDGDDDENDKIHRFPNTGKIEANSKFMVLFFAQSTFSVALCRIFVKHVIS